MRCLIQMVVVLSLAGLGSIAQAGSVQLSRIVTGYGEPVPEAMLVTDGRWGTERKIVHQAMVIRHPRGLVLFDTGLGHQTRSIFDELGWLDRKFLAYTPTEPAVDVLARAGIKPKDIYGIVLSHLHWDHTGGVPDFPGTPILTVKSALPHAMHVGPPAFFLPQLSAIETVWVDIPWTDVNYEGFARSFDLFGDGKVVLVEMNGHTPGDVGMFVNLDSGARVLLIGDVTWTHEGVAHQAPRPSFVQWWSKVDWDRKQNIDAIHHVGAVTARYPELLVVPAHDENVSQDIPEFPAVME